MPTHWISSRFLSSYKSVRVYFSGVLMNAPIFSHNANQAIEFYQKHTRKEQQGKLFQK
jgi:hypothetical protein